MFEKGFRKNDFFSKKRVFSTFGLIQGRSWSAGPRISFSVCSFLNDRSSQLLA